MSSWSAAARRLVNSSGWRYRRLYASVPDGQVNVEFHETHRLVVLVVLVGELQGLRAAGELDDYTDEELLGVNISVIWRKPLH